MVSGKVVSGKVVRWIVVVTTRFVSPFEGMQNRVGLHLHFVFTAVTIVCSGGSELMVRVHPESFHSSIAI